MSVRETAPARGVVLVADVGFEYGAAIATEFLDAGWSVAVTARTITELVRVMAGKPAHRFFGIVADPTDRAQAHRVVARVTARFGEVTRVVDPGGVVIGVWSRRDCAESVA